MSRADITLLRSIRLLLLVSLRIRAQRQLKPAPYSSLAESTATCSGMPLAASAAPLLPPLLAASSGESRAWRKDLNESACIQLDAGVIVSASVGRQGT